MEARLECDRSNPKGCYNLGLIHLREGKQADSLKPFKKACELQEPLGCLGLALAWEQEAQHAQEKRAWVRVWVWSRMALEMHLKHPDAERLFKEASRHMNGSRVEEAESLLVQARQHINPNPSGVLGPLPRKEQFDAARVVEIPVPVPAESAPVTMPSEGNSNSAEVPEDLDSFLDE